jgi:hypothetical protein
MNHDRQRRDTSSRTASVVLQRVDLLIDDLLNHSDLSSSSVASILMAARESVRDGYHVALARRVWDLNNDLRLRQCPEGPSRSVPASRIDD